jgi:hypothetical protein
LLMLRLFCHDFAMTSLMILSCCAEAFEGQNGSDIMLEI